MSVDTETTDNFGYNDPAFDDSPEYSPSWRSERDPDAPPNYYRADPPRPADELVDDDLDDMIEAAYAEHHGEAPSYGPPSGPGKVLKWAVGGATIIVTALGTFVFAGPIAALVPLAAGGMAVGAAATRGRGTGAGAGGMGAGRRQRMQGGGASGGPGASRGRTGGGGGGRGRAGGGLGGGRAAGGGRARAGSGGGGRAAGAGRPAAGRAAGAGRPAGAGAGAGAGRAAGRAAGAGRGRAGGAAASGTQGRQGGARPTSTKGAGTGAGRRKAMQGTGTGPVAKVAKALTGRGGSTRRGGSSTGPKGTGAGKHRATGSGRTASATPKTTGAPTGPASSKRKGATKGRKSPQGAQQGRVAPARTMRQRAARVGGDFARGLWALPSYPARQVARGTRAAARAGWNAPGTRRLRRHVRRRAIGAAQASLARRLKRSRKVAKKQQRYYLRKWWPRQLRRATRPARWVHRHLVDDRAWYRAQLNRAGRWAHRRRRLATVRMARRVRRARAYRPAWWTQLQTFIAVNGGARAALAVILTALAAAIARMSTGTRPAAAPTTRPQPRPRMTQPAPAGPTPQGARPGTPQTRPAPAKTAGPRGPMPTFPRPTPTPAPAGATTAGGTPQMARTADSVDVSIPAGLHPSLGRIAEASYKCTATWNPQSPPDLHVYLESQPAALKIMSDIHRQFGDRLAATFPGANLAHAFFAQVAHGYAGLQAPAFDLFRGWESLHAGDLARFRSPRVNEHYSDVARHGVQVANVPVLDNGNRWHYNHTIMTEVTRSQLFNLTWGVVEQDRINELLNWLDSLPLLFDVLCRHTLAMGRYLVQNMPVDPRLGDFYRSLARGYLGLADQADELSDGYRARNRADTDRRERPRPNEKWFDFSNQQMTGV